jgi:hypothetical protein
MGDSEPTSGDADRARIEAEFLERLQEEMRHITVEDHLLHLVRSLPSMAFQYMGIYQAEGVQDLTQARLAIEAFRVLLDVLAPVRTPEEMAMYRSTLAQMQMTYVTAAEHEAGGPTRGAAAGAEEGDSEVAEAVYDDEPAAKSAAEDDRPADEQAPESTPTGQSEEEE